MYPICNPIYPAIPELAPLSKGGDGGGVMCTSGSSCSLSCEELVRWRFRWISLTEDILEDLFITVNNIKTFPRSKSNY